MTTRKITLMALFAALSIIATRFLSLMIPLGGFPTLSIGFGGIPIMLSGMLFGPLAGGIVGGISDLLGFLINDRGGVYHPGFTLNSILTGVIPGLLFLMIKKYKIQAKTMRIINYVLLICSSIVGAYYLWSNQHLASSPWIIWMLIGLLFVICVITIIVLERLIKKEHMQRQISAIILCVLLVELLVYVGLTPIWIYGLYGIPSVVSIISRVLRLVFFIPIKVLLLVAIVKVTTKREDLL